MVHRPRDAVERRRDRWSRLEPHLRRGPLRADAFAPSRLHGSRPAAVLGIALGMAFTVCFVTGWLSHLIQHPPTWSWWSWPARPAGLYRVTQGLHVATGIAAVPLLLTKLWVVYRHLFAWPPVRGGAHLVERIALVPLVGGSLLLLATGLANIAGWYPWPFFFIQGHYAAAWITIGALVMHFVIKLPVTVAALRGRELTDDAPPPSGFTRRGLLAVGFGGAGLVTLLTVGQTFWPLRALALLAPRDPQVGSQGLPINRTAARARVAELAGDPAYRLVVAGDVATPLTMTLDDLAALPLRTAELPIACVEGWSRTATWRGVPVRDLLEMAGAGQDAAVLVESLEPRGPYRRSELPATHAADPDTMLALELNGETLDLDHGYPVRLIAPNLPGVMNTKWVGRLTVRTSAGRA